MKREKHYAKKKTESSFKLFLYKLDIILFRFLDKFSKDSRIRKKKRKKESYNLFLHKLDARLFRFLGWFSKESSYQRKKKRKDILKYILFRTVVFFEQIAYWNSKEIRKIRRKKREMAWKFFLEKSRFFLDLYFYRVYKTFVDIKNWLKISENRKGFITNMVTSSILFIIAYFFTYFLYQIATAYMAKAYSIPSVIYFFKTDFLIRSYSNLWTRNNVILVSFIGPFISLIIGFVLYRIFHLFKRKPGLIKLFFLWCALHAFNMFFGAYIAGVITNKGFGLAMLWMFFQLLLNISFTFICVIFLIIIGSLASRSFLQTAHHSSLISEPNKTYFLIGQALLPYIIGNIFIFLISLPDVKPYQSFILAAMGFMIVPIILKPNFEQLKIVKEETPHKINRKLVLAFIIILLIFRIGLDYGFRI